MLLLFSQQENGEETAIIPSQKAAGEPKSSMISASFNFINSIIGSGIIGKSSPYLTFSIARQDPVI